MQAVQAHPQPGSMWGNDTNMQNDYQHSDNDGKGGVNVSASFNINTEIKPTFLMN